jgi:hypothetical protein
MIKPPVRAINEPREYETAAMIRGAVHGLQVGDASSLPGANAAPGTRFEWYFGARLIRQI